MANNTNITEDLFNAVSLLINNETQHLKKDESVLCTVVDDTNKAAGSYKVTDGSTTFEAHGSNNYRKNQNVWVTIPNGDFTQPKIIIGKYVTSDSTPFTWVPPMESFANFTGNIFTGNPEEGNLGELTANKPADDLDIYLIAEGIDVSDYNDFTRMGISADFRTELTREKPVKGNYGLLFNINTFQMSQDGSEEKDLNSYQYIFDSSDMWGNPLNFESNFTQEQVFNISRLDQNEYLSSIDIYFYQKGNFEHYNDRNELEKIEPAAYKELQDDGTEIIIDYIPNLFVNNLSIAFGYGVEETSEDKVYLYTKDNDSYSISNLEHPDITDKTLEIRWIHIDANGKAWAINDKAQIALPSDVYEEYIKSGETLRRFTPFIHWYYYDQETGVDDIRAGSCWKEIDVNQDFSKLVRLPMVIDGRDFLRKQIEKFKVMIVMNEQLPPKREDYESDEDYADAIKAWKKDVAKKETHFTSEVLEFINSDTIDWTREDLIKDIQITCTDKNAGVFNLYNSSLNANSELINSADGSVARTAEVNYISIESFQKDVDDDKDKEIIIWYLPRVNTMISPPTGYTYSEGQENFDRILNRLKRNDWNELENPFEILEDIANEYNAELDKYENLKIYNDGYIVDDSNPDYYICYKLKETDNHKLIGVCDHQIIYRINKIFRKSATNNTIKCEIVRYQKSYEQTKNLSFGVSGSNGTNYTLALELGDEYTKDDVLFRRNVSAWTYDNSNTGGYLQLRAQLYDANDEPISDLVYKWTKTYPGASISGAEISEGKLRENDILSYGCVVKCEVRHKAEDDNMLFYGYLAVPVRSSDEFIALSGPDTVMYDAKGTQVTYNNTEYLIIDRNNQALKTVTGSQHIYRPEDAKWLPSLKTDGGAVFLVPKAMYYNDVEYDYKVQIDTAEGYWCQPILIYMNPYGNQYVNQWNGDLTIDKDANAVMAATLGAGKKEADNTFTGLIIGVDPDKQRSSTGIIGYKNGLESYGILDNGTAFFGQSGWGRIEINGNSGYIQSGNFTQSGDTTTGMKIDLKNGNIYAPNFRLGNTNKIAGWTINDDNLSASNITIKAGGGISSKNWWINDDGTATFKDIKCQQGSSTLFQVTPSLAQIGGWIIDSDSIRNTNGTVYLSSGGREYNIYGASIYGGKIQGSDINVVHGSGYFKWESGNNHPSVSGLNVGSGGIQITGSGAGVNAMEGDIVALEMQSSSYKIYSGGLTYTGQTDSFWVCTGATWWENYLTFTIQLHYRHIVFRGGIYCGYDNTSTDTMTFDKSILSDGD